jgi:hypothetical protein
VGAGIAEVIFERELSDLKPPDDVARGLFGGKRPSEFGLGRARDLRPGASSFRSGTITRSTRVLRISMRRLNCNAPELDKAFFIKGGTGLPGQEQRRSITLRMMGVVFSNDSRRMYSLG